MPELKSNRINQTLPRFHVKPHGRARFGLSCSIQSLDVSDEKMFSVPGRHLKRYCGVGQNIVWELVQLVTLGKS